MSRSLGIWPPEIREQGTSIRFFDVGAGVFRPSEGCIVRRHFMARRSSLASGISIFISVVIFAFSLSPAFAGDSDVPDPLVQLLTQKGVLTADEAASIVSVSPQQQHQALLNLLREKGVISATEFSALAPA